MMPDVPMPDMGGELTESQHEQVRTANHQAQVFLSTQPKNSYHPESWSECISKGAQILGENPIYPPIGGFGTII